MVSLGFSVILWLKKNPEHWVLSILYVWSMYSYKYKKASSISPPLKQIVTYDILSNSSRKQNLKEQHASQLVWVTIEDYRCCWWERGYFMLIYKCSYGKTWKYDQLRSVHHNIIGLKQEKLAIAFTFISS